MHFWAQAEPSGKIQCWRTGTVKQTSCHDHIINRSPSNPAGKLVTYCADCEEGPGGYVQNCSERYIQMFQQDPKPPFSERISPGVIEQTQPLSQQESDSINENVAPQRDITE